MPRVARGSGLIRTTLAAAGTVTMATAGWLTIVDGRVDVSDGSAEAAPGHPGTADTESAQGVADARPAPADRANHGRQTAKADATGGKGESSAPAERRVLEVERGDTLITLLQEAGLSGGEAFRAVSELESVYTPSKLRPGQEIRIALATPAGSDSAGAAPKLDSLRLRASAERDVTLARGADGDFTAQTVRRELTRTVARARGTIESSLMRAAGRTDVPMKPLLKVIRGFSYAVDFQRDLRRGNGFEVVYERFRDPEGKIAKVGDLLYAALETRGDRLEMYRFERANGDVDYFNAKGESVRRLLMRTPINGARLSSGYGMREHPILGYSKMHEGVDFAAPQGTPIFAAGNGRIEHAGWNGGYGRFVRIDHSKGFSTAYGHMARLANGIQPGTHVSQGDVIGYVGSTGRSTGPHLHYEIRKHGEPVNPRNLDLPTGYELTGDALARFKTVKARIDARRKGDAETRVAEAGCSASDGEGC